MKAFTDSQNQLMYEWCDECEVKLAEIVAALMAVENLSVQDSKQVAAVAGKVEAARLIVQDAMFCFDED